MQKTTLEFGTYKLTQDVTNPKPNRRTKHDWRCLPTWSAGMIFRVGLHPGGWTELWHGSFSIHNFTFNERDTRWKLLLPHLEKQREAPSDWLEREHAGLNLAYSVLNKLFEEGKFTLEDVARAAGRVLNVDPEEYAKALPPETPE